MFPRGSTHIQSPRHVQMNSKNTNSRCQTSPMSDSAPLRLRDAAGEQTTPVTCGGNSGLIGSSARWLLLQVPPLHFLTIETSEQVPWGQALRKSHGLLLCRMAPMYGMLPVTVCGFLLFSHLALQTLLP